MFDGGNPFIEILWQMVYLLWKNDVISAKFRNVTRIFPENIEDGIEMDYDQFLHITYKEIYGALAQLGACLHGMEEVTGSNPVCSI